MPSSNPSPVVDRRVTDRRVATYAFEQLDPTEQAKFGGVADVLSAAWAEADQVRAQAREEGEAAGRAEGIAAAQAEAAPALAALSEAVRGIEALGDELVGSLESQAAELALRLAEQIVGGAIAAEPSRVLDITRGALRRLAERHRVTVLVHPADLELLTPAVESIQSSLGGIEHLDVQADRRIERGGAIARTESGEVDATIGAQLQTAREIVIAALLGGESESDESDESVDAG
jgi:flagellar assembly protein FliH